MPWVRDTQAPLGARLRTLVVLLLIVAIVSASSLPGSWGTSTWLNPGGMGTVAGSVPGPPGAPGEPVLAAAAKRKTHNKNHPGQDTDTHKHKHDDKHKHKDQGKDKSGKKDTGKGKNDHTGKGTGKNDKKHTHPGGGKGPDKNDTTGKSDKNGKKGQDAQDPSNTKGKEQAGPKDPSQKDPSQKDPSQKDPSQKDPSQKDPSQKDGTSTTPAEVTAAAVTAAAAPLTVAPVADSQANEANPNYNYGARTALLVDGGTDPDVASYLLFNVSGVTAPVQQATLRLWVQPSGGSQNGPLVQATGTAWSETGLTWSTRPGPTGAVLADKGVLTGGTWAEYTVTSAVKGNGAVGFVLLTDSTDGAVFDSREGATKPQLLITLGSGTSTPTPTTTPGPTPTPTPTPPPSLGSNVSLPVRATFYYPWFPHAWKQGTVSPYTNYLPSLGYYDGGDAAIIGQQIAAMQYGGISVGIASWWGVGEHTDARIPALLSAAAGTGFRWALYYEAEGTANPSVDQIRADLTSIRDRYASDPSYARVDGRFVVFVYNANDGDCTVADRWQQANTVGAYVVLKVFAGYKTCAKQPQSWHQYSPVVAADHQRGFSYAISPGFWQKGQGVRLARDLARWEQNVRDMVASGAPWQLVTTFNEWGEGTAVESAVEWASPSGYGAYLDALHRNGQP